MKGITKILLYCELHRTNFDECDLVSLFKIHSGYGKRYNCMAQLVGRPVAA